MEMYFSLIFWFLSCRADRELLSESDLWGLKLNVRHHLLLFRRGLFLQVTCYVSSGQWL